MKLYIGKKLNHLYLYIWIVAFLWIVEYQQPWADDPTQMANGDDFSVFGYSIHPS